MTMKEIIKNYGDDWHTTPSGEGIAFSPCAGFDVRPWGNENPINREVLDLIAAAPNLFRALNELQANPNDPRAHRVALDTLKKASPR